MMRRELIYENMRIGGDSLVEKEEMLSLRFI